MPLAASLLGMFELSGTAALVTGVGSKRGIGFAIAEGLLSQGAQLFITSTTERVFERESELEKYAKERFGSKAPHIHAQIADLTNSAQVEYMFKGIPKLDILLNNAGMSSLKDPLGESEALDLARLSDVGWQLGIARNLDTAFKVTRAALPLLRSSSRGRIIMISSLTGARMAMAQQPAYAAAKAGLSGLMRSISIDEAKYQITCNAILPGWIATDTQPHHEASQGKKVPLGRSGQAAEIAAAVCFLASGEAGYITGQELVIDGGNSVSEERF